MTTLQFCKDTDAFHVVNDSRSAYVERNKLYAVFTDADLIDAATKAIEVSPEVVTVSSKTAARGVRNPRGDRHGVLQ
jgi:hypothetical protein